MVVGTQCPVLLVTDLANDAKTTIAELAAGKLAVIDFWTTKCVRCPLAIEKLNSAAPDPKYANVQFFTICTDVAEVAKEIVEDEEWDNLTHTFMELEQKEMCKAHFGFKSVPHYVVIDPAGTVVLNVSTKFDLACLDALISDGGTPAASTPAKPSAPAAPHPSPSVTPVQGPATSLADAAEEARLREENEVLRQRIAALSAKASKSDWAPGGIVAAAAGIQSAGPAEEQDEYLLRDNPGRFVIFPIGDQPIWEMYKKAETDLWTAEEVDLSKDAAHLHRLPAAEQRFVTAVLAGFAAEDIIANESLVERFAQEVQIAEARFFFGFQMAMHNIHAEVYSMLLDSYVPDQADRAYQLSAAKTSPCAAQKAAWYSKWISSGTAHFAHQLVAFACHQGIFGSASFASIFWLKHRKHEAGMTAPPGLIGSNEKIARDEQLYTDFTTMLYAMLKNKPSNDDVVQIVTEAVEIEKKFAAAGGCCDPSLIGLDPALMAGYLESVGDKLLSAFGLPKHYNRPNPFDWLVQHESQRQLSNAKRTASKPTMAAPMGEMGAASGVLSFGMDDDF